MKKICLNLTKILIAGCLSIFLLSLFTFVYRYSGVHITNQSQSTDYTWEKYQYQTNMREGYAWIKTDKNGFNNAYVSKKTNPDYLLMGSSHMEALQMSSDENAGYLLNDLISDYYVYNVGISGHTIYRCINNLNNANRQFSPSQGVIVETSLTDLDLEMMNKVLNCDLKPIRSYDKGWIYYVQKYMQSVKFLFNQLDEWKKMDSSIFAKRVEKSIPSTIHDQVYLNTLDKFLAFAKASMQNGQRLIIVYKPLTKIDKNGKYISTRNDRNTQVFKELCQKNDIEFIDLSDAFESLYYEKHILAHGFINSAVGVGHLNKYGHMVFAEEVAKVIGGKSKDYES